MTTNEYLQITGLSIPNAISKTIDHCEIALKGSDNAVAIVINDGQEEKLTMKQLSDRLIELMGMAAENVDNTTASDILTKMNVKFGITYEENTEEEE